MKTLLSNVEFARLCESELKSVFGGYDECGPGYTAEACDTVIVHGDRITGESWSEVISGDTCCVGS